MSAIPSGPAVWPEPAATSICMIVSRIAVAVSSSFFASELSDSEAKKLELTATAIRETIIQMLVAAGSGHTAGPLGMADIFAAFYFHILKQDPKNPAWE